MKNKDFDILYERAREKGLAAGEAAMPAPMIVRDANGKVYEPVMDGVCGFAWVKVTPGNSRFANYLKKNGFARKSYNGGVNIWIGEFRQSLDRKEAMANAMANEFKEAGIKAYAQSRMD